MIALCPGPAHAFPAIDAAVADSAAIESQDGSLERRELPAMAFPETLPGQFGGPPGGVGVSIFEFGETGGAPAATGFAPNIVSQFAPDTSGTDISIRDVMRSLVNISSEGRQAGIRTARRPPDGRARGPADRTRKDAAKIDLVDMVMGSAIDPVSISLLETILHPRVDASGIVRFSIAGLGDFAMVVAREDSAVILVDMQRGGHLSFGHGGAARDNSGPAALTPGDGRRRNARGPSAAVTMFWRVVYYVMLVVRHPLFISAMVILLVISMLWGMAKRS